MPVPAPARRLFPKAGPAYELFDCAAFLLVLAFVGYILTAPPPVTDKALSAPFALYDQHVWGWGLSVCAVVAIVLSYFDRWLDIGYRIVTAACIFWGGCFLYGWLLYGGGARVWLSIVLYGWIASRLRREAKRSAALTQEDK